MKWTEKQIEYIKNNYTPNNIQNIADYFSVSYNSIKSVAYRNKISCGHQKYKKLKPLFLDNHLSWYWKGFIMADGHLSNDGTLMVSSHIKDIKHIEKLCNLLSIEYHIREIKTNYKNSSYCFLSCKDCEYGPKILNKLGIKNPKTYNPPNISNIPDEYILSFFVGFFDGDGYFPTCKSRPNVSKIRIIVHKNWLPTLEFLKDKLEKYNFSSIKTSINKRGFAQIICYGQDSIKYIKDMCIKNNIPILERKWDKV
jgi:hypothetical protein